MTDTRIKGFQPGDTVMVRTYSAGVFYGEIVINAGKKMILANARRVWYWSGAATLSQLAIEGTSDPENCKFPLPVDLIELTECIEKIPMTPRAIESLNAVKVWRA